MDIDDLFRKLENDLFRKLEREIDSAANKINDIDFEDFFRNRTSDRKLTIEVERHKSESINFLMKTLHVIVFAAFFAAVLILLTILVTHKDNIKPIQSSPPLIEQPISNQESTPLKKI